MKNTVRVSYRLPIEVAKMLEDEAVRARRTKTAVLIIAIEDHVLRCDDERSDWVEKPVDTKKKR
jgi:predicted DNA-binding protein|tara:strand:- start:556 stop:747 length:192 start_codon:yes stop_codon:yes gene_type:complete